MHFTHAILLFFAAAIAGTLNAIAGGGSFVSFPALLFTGVPAVQANATSTVALWPGLAASTVVYLKRLDAPVRLLLPLLITSIAGGWVGALLLLHTPQRTFVHLVPWLLLSGTLLFAFGNQIRAIAGRASAVEDLHQLSWVAIAVSSAVQIPVAIYGGYFGAGIGFVILGMLAALGMRDILAMGALRTLLAAASNVSAVVTFIWAGAVLWPQCGVMLAGALTGGWFGAHFTQKADPKKMRYAVIAVGLAMSAYFFIRGH
ncbi:MAG TPA: sulfite exporter TauE/SafE family protein [Candidatus Limnocylindrales bacterium]|nr:sulfite exporter TauE/SafE family protein [Candidatus Limnocylindrales bacterium]